MLRKIEQNGKFVATVENLTYFHFQSIERFGYAKQFFSADRFSLVRRLISGVRRAKSQIIPKIGRVSENELQEVL